MQEKHGRDNSRPRRRPPGGLDRAKAERFIAEGATVFLSDINAAKLETTAAEVGLNYTV